jgi:hypothetical protein
MRKTVGLTLVLALLAGGVLVPQAAAKENAQSNSQESQNAYKVEFEITEIENGTPVNTRHYYLRLKNQGQSRIRTGNKVPLPSPDGVNYMDVGLRLDCTLFERGKALELRVAFEIESFALEEQARNAGAPPLIREIQSNVTTIVTPGQPTIISKIDDAASSSRYELKVTVTKVE